MKDPKTLAQTKFCTGCNKRLPLDAEHWRRNASSPDGFYTQCKSCTKQVLKDHYRRYTKVDVAERGEVGVKCILWSSKCGVCPCISESDLSACWRLAKMRSDGEGYPIELE
jgi:hypothetical protein